MDLMIYGEVSYKHHHGHETGVDWAVKMRLVKEGGEVKVGVYHIIVVSFFFFLESGRLCFFWTEEEEERKVNLLQDSAAHV